MLPPCNSCKNKIPAFESCYFQGGKNNQTNQKKRKNCRSKEFSEMAVLYWLDHLITQKLLGQMAFSFSKLVPFSLTEFIPPSSTPKNLIVMICLVLNRISKKKKKSVLFLNLYLPIQYIVRCFLKKDLYLNVFSQLCCCMTLTFSVTVCPLNFFNCNHRL